MLPSALSGPPPRRRGRRQRPGFHSCSTDCYRLTVSYAREAVLGAMYVVVPQRTRVTACVEAVSRETLVLCLFDFIDSSVIYSMLDTIEALISLDIRPYTGCRAAGHLACSSIPMHRNQTGLHACNRDTKNRSSGVHTCSADDVCIESCMWRAVDQRLRPVEPARRTIGRVYQASDFSVSYAIDVSVHAPILATLRKLENFSRCMHSQLSPVDRYEHA